MKLRLDNIYFSYREQKVLEEFCFDYSGPGTVIVSGANGSGKTTLLKLMAGVLKPQQGVIETYVIPEIGYVPENPVLWENLTVREQIRMMVKLYSVDISKECIKLIDDLELNLYEDIYARKLSNGYRRKLNFILSILHNPKLLILDEIFNALDERSIETVMDYLQGYAKDHLVVLATNRRDIGEHIYDEIITLGDVYDS